MKYKLLVLIALRQLYNQNKFTKQVQAKLQHQYFSKVINVMDDAYWEQITNFEVNREKMYTCLWISLILEPLDLKKDGSSLKISLLLLSLLFLSSTELKCNPNSFHWRVWQRRCCHRSVAQSYLTLQPRGLQQARLPCPSPLLEFAHTHVLSQWCHPAISSSVAPSPPAHSLSQHQGLFQWVSTSHQVTKVLELQLQHQPFQWIFRVDFL